MASSAPVGGSPQAFVQLFEWSWDDVAKECEEWLGPKKFAAVQVSPPQEHIQGPQWWTRYQPVSYKLTSRSGDEAAFTSMVSRCKKAGVAVYADAVINHCAAGGGVGVAGSNFGSRSYPMFSQEDFHHNDGDPSRNCGVSNYADRHNVQSCDLVGLPDLCTGCEKVQNTVADYINHMASIGIGGFRVDAAKHQAASELGQLLSKVNSNLFRFQEVISGVGEAVQPTEYLGIGHVTEFNYARQLAPNFIQEGKLQYLNTFGESWGFLPGDHAVAFLDNHDTQRGEAQLTYKSGDLYVLANVFMLAHPYGMPHIMSSYYFNDKDQGPPSTPVHRPDGGVNCGNGQSWVCEHRMPAVANMVAWRATAGNEGVVGFTAAPGGNAISFCRGSQACIAINRGSSPWSASFTASVPAGQYCDIIHSSGANGCPSITVGAGGQVSVQVPAMSAVAFHVGAPAGLVEAFV